ncbi:hypothetical protein [Campylobacter sp. RM12637]|uniref:hypothetical protein n=1 Tax=Campylobacter sp. RM12637 TaxID=2735734 RepID=UPI00301576A9|nr:hypothetical protein [Campylobacter sp. RM12637]
MYKISIDDNLTRIIKKRKFSHALRPFLGCDSLIDKELTHANTHVYLKTLAEQIKLLEPRIIIKKLALNGTNVLIDYEVIESKERVVYEL